MTDLILDNISLILLLPLWIFLIIMCGRFFSVYVNKNILYFLTLLASFLGISACGFALLNIKEPIDFLYPFIKIKDFTIFFGLQIDKLSILIALVLFIISFAVQLFSISYMKKEKKNYRFFALLNLFNFAMAFLLFSPNLFQFYVFWELVSIVSYLLIGFEYKNETKSMASKRVFIINRIGDTALISGIILTSYYMFEYVQNKMFITLSFQDFNAISTLLMAYTSTPVFLFICGLFILAAMVKSAQFPFYTWLQDAMEAKLPVSALLHSATMVIAGVYLIIRLMPFFTLNPLLLKLIAIIGIFTALICAVLASIETYPKKILAYSTSANLGLMFFAVGTCHIGIALIILIAHAFIKSTLFLSLPNEKLQGIGYSRFFFFCINGLSLSGILFAGIGAKELMYTKISSQSLSVLYLFISFITAYYITRLAILIYKKNEFTHTRNYTKAFSYTILLCGNLTLYLALRENYTIDEPFVAAIGGLCLALLFGKHNFLEKIQGTPKIMEKLFYNLIPKMYDKFTNGMNYLNNNILANYKPLIFISKTGVNIIEWMEINIFNKTVCLVSDFSKWVSKQDLILQSKNIQTYNAYAFIIITIISAIVIIGYTFILN